MRIFPAEMVSGAPHGLIEYFKTFCQKVPVFAYITEMLNARFGKNGSRSGEAGEYFMHWAGKKGFFRALKQTQLVVRPESVAHAEVLLIWKKGKAGQKKGCCRVFADSCPDCFPGLRLKAFIAVKGQSPFPPAQAEGKVALGREIAIQITASLHNRAGGLERPTERSGAVPDNHQLPDAGGNLGAELRKAGLFRVQNRHNGNLRKKWGQVSRLRMMTPGVRSGTRGRLKPKYRPAALNKPHAGLKLF